MPNRKILLAALLFSLLVPVRSQTQKAPDRYTETVASLSGDKTSFDMVLIKESSFFMGSPIGEEGRDEDEGPRREVQLSPYYLAATETTLELFLVYYRETHAPAEDYFPEEAQDVDTVTGPTPVYGDLTMGRGEHNPAIGLTWQNAVTFCKWLSSKTGREYRLPTEAEWENACRCGTDQAFGMEDDPSRLDEYARFKSGPSQGTEEVGSRTPNTFGLYDMQGNVSEWVHDFYAPNGYQTGLLENPRGPATGKVHVARGGHYRSRPEFLRCASRDHERSWWRSGDPQLPKSKWWLPDMDHIGFRVARSASQ